MKTESEDRPRQSDAIEIYVEDHQLPQNILEEIVFEKFVQKYQNNLEKLEAFLDTL